MAYLPNNSKIHEADSIHPLEQLHLTAGAQPGTEEYIWYLSIELMNEWIREQMNKW